MYYHAQAYTAPLVDSSVGPGRTKPLSYNKGGQNKFDNGIIMVLVPVLCHNEEGSQDQHRSNGKKANLR